METISAFKVGDRVQLHPATDAWMQGDRFGTVVGLLWRSRFALRIVRVKMDVSGRVKLFHPDNVLPAE